MQHPSAISQTIAIRDFDHWRQTCRTLLAMQIAPDSVSLVDQTTQGMLFSDVSELPTNDAPPMSTSSRVPPEFIDLAEAITCHRDAQRWNLLYQALWRLTHGQPNLLQLVTDDCVHTLMQFAKQIKRDCHKMKAFVRFRKVMLDGREHYIAWHCPDHKIVRRVAPFFARRFSGMIWTILTPDESVHWDGESLIYGNGVARSQAPQGDDLEHLWKTYYGSIFNPARIKVDSMKREMPVRHWRTLPETELIQELLEDAPNRVNEMIARTEGMKQTAADYIPAAARSIEDLRRAAKDCRGCDLCLNATQTVFGRGSKSAKLVVIGEQPGDEEDLQGEPFVGPAGRLLNEILEECEIDRNDIYLTNAVKHFRFQRVGKARLHKKPTVRQISACNPWLEEELRLVNPTTVVCLGATALQAYMGRQYRLTDIRGHNISFDNRTVIPTWHPAAILRSPDDLRVKRRTELANDLQLAAKLAVQ